METFYLIDYENVHSEGLSGCQSLTKTDHIVIFFTQNAKSIDMSTISNHGAAVLEMVEVPAGKQSSDMHIGSYLGYLAGKFEKNCKAVIISKDTDFDKVIKFWKDKVGINASRKQQIKSAPAKSITPAKTTTAKTSAVKTSESKENTTSAKSKNSVNVEIQKALSKEGIKNDVISYVASTAVKNLNVKNGKQQTYRTIVAKYGQNKGLELYTYIKKLI